MPGIASSQIARPPIHRARVPGAAWDMPALCAARNDPMGFGNRPVKIAIGELGGGFEADNVKTAMAAWNLPEPDIQVCRGTSRPGSDADGEVELDIQVAAARAARATGRGAIIGLFFGGNTDAEFLACQDAMNQWNPDAQTWSWGSAEPQWQMPVVSKMVDLHSQAPCPIFAAAGDSDSGDGLSGANVDFPGSSPFVIDCGGTLFIAGGSTPEQVWNDGPGNGGGGGWSAIFGPQDFQVGIPVGNGSLCPTLADVASPRTGYKIYIRAQGGWQEIGGTSAVAPSMAGLFGAYQVEMEKRGLPRMKFISDRLFRHPVGFKDITVGNNGRWRAQAGPDPCTGLGVPDGTELFNQLVGSAPGPTPPPVVTPPGPKPPPAPTTDPEILAIEGLARAWRMKTNTPAVGGERLGIV